MADTAHGIAARDAATRPGPARTRHGWLFVSIWLVYMVEPLNQTFDGRRGAFPVALGAGGLALFCVLYSRIAYLNRVETAAGTPRFDRRTAWLLAALTAVAAVMPLVSVSTWIALWIYVSAAFGFTLPTSPRNWALRGGLLATAVICVAGPLAGLAFSDWASWVLPALFNCYGMLGIRRMQCVIDQLKEARDEVKRLAASEERLRMARDLHDLAGHSLATITLKAELARKLLAVDPQAAERQLLDIEQVSRQSLADFREAVSGYRRPTLAVETASARTALDAAGITLHAHPSLVAPRAAGDLDPSGRRRWRGACARR
jgi:two-component system, NarL family, sensor histidine kinase DesK